MTNIQEFYLVNLTKKYVIGTHVMWFEIEMFKDFVDGLINLLETVENKENVIVDLCFNLSQKLEKIDKNKIKKHELLIKFKSGVAKLESIGFIVEHNVYEGDDFYFHADYRRDLNYNYCKKVDYVMWGETDSFFPKEAFQVIETLSEYTKEQNMHRYLLSFADRKMWDSSWDPLVHVDYESHVFVDDDKGWYDPDELLPQLPNKNDYDLILIDGPGGWLGRSGFLKYLDVFNTDVSIIIDDIQRDQEFLLLKKLSEKLQRKHIILDDKCTGVLLGKS